MTSTKKIFIASLLSAVVSLVPTHSSGSAPAPPDGLKECIEEKLKNSFGQNTTVGIQSITDANGEETIEVTVSGLGEGTDYCAMRCVIKECLEKYKNENTKIQIKIATGEGAWLYYKGTVVDLDIKSPCKNTFKAAPIDTLALHLDGTLKILENESAKRVDRDSKGFGLIGVRRLELKVVTQQIDGKPSSVLRVRGAYRVANGKQLTPDKAKTLLLSSIRKYTGALRIDDEELRVTADR